MNPQTLLDNFPTLADAPGGIPRLHELILDLAMHGRLLSPKTSTTRPLKWDATVLRLDERKLWHAGDVSNVPHSWSVLPLAALGKWGSGGTPAKGNRAYYNGTIPWLVIGDLNDAIVTRAETHITAKGLDESSATLVPIGSVFVAMYGSIGKSGIAGIECATNQAIAHCVPNTDIISSDYLFRLILAIRPHLFSQGRGLAQQNISQTILKHLLLPIPPRSEQDQIVAKIDELMALCNQLEAEKKNRDSLRTTARKSAIDAISTATTPEELSVAWSRFRENWITFADTPESIASLRELILDLAIRGKLVDSTGLTADEKVEWDASRLRLDTQKIWRIGDHSDLPRNWNLLPLAALGKWGSGGTPTKGNKSYYDGEIPWLVIGDLNDSIVVKAETHITAKGLAESSATIIPVGAVLVAMYGSIGKSGIAGIECATNQAIAHCVPDTKVISSEYLFRLIIGLRRHLFSQGRGLAQQNISQTILKHLIVPVPPINEQLQIIAKVDKLMALCDQLEAELIARNNLATRLAASVVHHLGNAA
jgi:type I restriction enzyme S subunit